MKGFARTASLATAFTVGTGLQGLAQANDLAFTTAAGNTLILAPVSEMKCAEIDKMLARIDATRYRKNAPTPLNAADAPLYEYESLLAEESYNRCVVVRKKTQDDITIMRSRVE